MPMSPGEMMSNGTGAMPMMQGGAPNEAEAAAAPPEENPIIQALRDLMTFVAAKRESGDPAAGEMIEHLRSFMELAGGGDAGSGVGSPPPTMPPAPPQPQQQQSAPAAMPGRSRGGMVPVI